MLIVADIGNTAIKFGFVRNGEIFRNFSLPSSAQLYTADSLGLSCLQMLNCLNADKNEAEAFCICSVVPRFDSLFRNMAKKFFGKPCLIAGQDLEIPIKNRYERPDEVGADRLVASYGSHMLFPDKKNIVTIDYGTATTFDCFETDAEGRGSYLGGLICPGILSSHTALSEKAAKLPRTALETDDSMPQINRNTEKSIAHGFVFGFAAMTRGLLEQLSRQMSGTPYVVATGGFAQTMAKHVPTVDATRPDLILQGLLFLYNNKMQKDGKKHE